MRSSASIGVSSRPEASIARCLLTVKLRILEGVPASWFEPARYEAFVQSGLLDEDFGHLVPTERGMLLLNELVLGLTS